MNPESVRIMKLKSCITISLACLACWLCPQHAIADDELTSQPSDYAEPIHEHADETPSSPPPATDTDLVDTDNWHSGFMLSANVGAHAGFIFFMVGTHAMGGLNAGIELGYHWRYFGIFVEQKIFGNWIQKTDTIFDDNSSSDRKNYDILNGAMGGTNLLLKFFIPAFDTFVIDLGLGAGLLYSKYHVNHTDTQTSAWAVLPALRAEIGFNWLLGRHLILGAKLDFSYLFFWGNVEPSFTVSYNF